MVRIANPGLEPTFVRRTFIAALVLALAGTGTVGAIGVRGASAGDDDARVEFRYLVGSGLTEVGEICEPDFPCPDAATASSNGDTIVISGEGKLSINQKNGRPKSVTGGGSFLHKDAAGHVLDVGTWTAKKLLAFKSFGPSVGFPPTFEGGLARIRVRLVSDSGALKALAILQVGCVLNEATAPEGAFEGAKLNIRGGLNFDQAIQRATLFINLGAVEEEDAD